MKKITFLFFLFLLAFHAQAQERSYPIYFASGQEKPSPTALQNAETASNTIGGYTHQVVQFYDIPTVAEQTAMRELGFIILEYFPDYAYLMAIPSAKLNDLERFKPRALIALQPKHKLQVGLLEAPYDNAVQHDDQLEVLIQYYADLRNDEVVSDLKQKKYSILKNTKRKNVITLLVLPTQLLDLANLPYVYHVERVNPQGKPEDTKGRAMHRSNTVNTEYATGRHYDGRGVKVCIRDDGRIGPHIDFQGRLDQHLCLGAEDFGSHGDMTSGIIAGAGNLDPTIKGMATGAFLYTLDYQADFLDSTLSLHLYNGVNVVSTSYSDGCNKGYEDNAQTVDQQLFENPYLNYVFSNGNANGASDCGYGAGIDFGNTTGGHKIGKNTITSANLTRTLIADPTSSRGPTADGRLKPDIAANGTDQLSTAMGNTSQIGGGTSAASPGVAGCLAQLSQAYTENNGGTIAEGGLLKAVLLNTANDLGNAGPDYTYGYGHVNLLQAVMDIEKKQHLKSTVANKATTTHKITIPAGTKELRVLLNWREKEASLGVSKVLINDLDLTLTSPDGTVSKPWQLEIAPDPLLLGAAAKRGEDHINTVEQVVVTSPTEGEWTINIKGNIVPLGNAEYFLSYHFVDNVLTLTYPFGGEKFVANETERLYWDAYGTTETFKFEYSTDSTKTWKLQNSAIKGTQRYFDWKIPATIESGKVFLRLSRDSTQSDMNDVAVTVMKIPTGLKSTQTCPDKLQVQWKKMPTAKGFQVFYLNEKYMESVGFTKDTFFNIPITTPYKDHWWSVAALSPDSTAGRRSGGFGKGSGLQNCLLDNDLMAVKLGNGILPAQFTCAGTSLPVQFELLNNSKTTKDSIAVFYQIDNDSIVKEIVADSVFSNKKTSFTFQKQVILSQSGQHSLKVWVGEGDEFAQNDTLKLAFEVYLIKGTENAPLSKDFEENIFPPTNWVNINPDNDLTWKAAKVIGKDGKLTQTLFMNNFDYNTIGQKDDLYSNPFFIDSTKIKNTAILSLDYSYARFSSSSTDSLIIDAYDACGTQLIKRLLVKGSAELATALATTSFWSPKKGDDWQTLGVDVSAFKGKNVVLKITNISRNGNNLYLDNLRIEDLTITAPIAGFQFSKDTICINEQVTVTNTSQGNLATYAWSFGTGASQSSATSPGPFSFKYATSGTKTIKLTLQNPKGTVTLSKNLIVRKTPTASFVPTVTTNTVSFANTSTNSTSQLWDFGDGATSTEFSPKHSYKSLGKFTVKLKSTNPCTSITSSKDVSIILSASNDLENGIVAQIQPNPTSGEFTLSLQTERNEDVNVTITDILGKTVFKNNYFKIKQLEEKINLSPLPSGIYLVRLKSETGERVMKVSVQ
ncbi:MAG: hypothetical protein RLZZ292_2691 [Bacteroidota bacterium]